MKLSMLLIQLYDILDFVNILVTSVRQGYEDEVVFISLHFLNAFLISHHFSDAVDSAASSFTARTTSLYSFCA